MELIVQDLMSHKDTLDGRIIVTGENPIPIEICAATISQREDMFVTHEEADTIIIRQIIQANAKSVLIIADDTDVFVLLCHFVYNNVIKGQVRMASPKRDRSVIDINATVFLHKDVMSNLLAAHGLTGCDTVATYFGIGKLTVTKVIRNNTHNLDALGNTNGTLLDALKPATAFVLSCYGQSKCSTMTEARQRVWSNKVSRTIGGAPKLESLPPTTEAFNENVARAHLQIAIWRHAKDADPPQMNPVMYGWRKEGESLTPIALPPNVPQAPEELLRMIRCSCESEMACKTKRCGCNNGNMACTDFCVCRGMEESCFNEKTRENQHSKEDEDNTDDNDNQDN